jgi:hypothetical protein
MLSEKVAASDKHIVDGRNRIPTGFPSADMPMDFNDSDTRCRTIFFFRYGDYYEGNLFEMKKKARELGKTRAEARAHAIKS